MRFLLMLIIFSFSVVALFSQNLEENISSPKTYRGDYFTKYYVGVAEYHFFEKRDGTRVYDGFFSFQGEGREVYVGELTRVAGTLINQKVEKEADVRIGKTYRRRIDIKGQFINGLKEGKWIYIIERYNDRINKYLPTDSTIVFYKSGQLDGLCTYVSYGTYSQNKIKEEKVTFVSNSFNNVIVYHYNNNPVKYESHYKDNEPTGIWVDKRSNGTYSFNFDTGNMTFLDNQTGQKKDTGIYFFSFPSEIEPFKHGFYYLSFWEATVDNCYADRIGALYIGDYFVQSSAIINQL